jgi:hypothetical protein
VAEIPLSSNLTNPAAFIGLSLILPIILLYLLKPKPKIVPFPSTMFIRFIEKNKRFTSFLQRFIHDPILVMQIFIISLLVLSLVNPFYTTKQEQRELESVVFIIDASASMQATDVTPNRFESSVATARDVIRDLNENDEVSIVLAENIPITVTTGRSLEDAWLTLGKLEPADTPSNLGDAIMLARDMLLHSERRKVIYVLSDFAGGGGLDPQLARKIAVLSGINVEFLKVGVRGANTGIVSLTARRSVVRENELFLTASVRNFHPVKYGTTLRVLSGDKVLASSEKTIDAGGEEFYYFKPNITSSEQVIKAELIGGDDMSVDDLAYVQIPAVRVNRILLLTSEGSDRYLRLMLESLKNVNIQYAIPPVLPEVTGFDIIILGNVRGENILPGTFRDIKNHVAKGAAFVVVAADSVGSIEDKNMWSIMPVDLLAVSSQETGVQVKQEHQVLDDVSFEQVIVKRHFNAKERDNHTKTLVQTKTTRAPIISYRPHGDGYVAYVGVNSNPDSSNLYYSSSFPIFWSQLIKYLTRPRDTGMDRSLQTGEYYSVPEGAKVKTPQGSWVESKTIFLDKAGVYTIAYPDGSEEFTVNLLDPVESNTTSISMEEMQDSRKYTVKREEIDVNVDLFRYILLVMLAALILESILYRRRGLL